MNIFFWSDWKSSYKYFYLFSLSILVFAIGFYLWSFYNGYENVIHWNTEGELEIIKTIINTFNKHLFEFTSDADSYLLIEKFEASNLEINFSAYTICLFLLIFGILLFLTAISDLGRNYYAGGIIIITLLVANMNLELLGILNQFGDKTFFLLIFASYIPLTFYFQSFNKKAHYLLRFSIYLLITIIYIWVISTFSNVTHIPILILNHGMAWPLIITLLFCALNAHEIIRIIIYITTANNTAESKGSLRHIVILSVIYFANLIYSYLYFTKLLSLDIFFLHPMIIFVIISVIGIWGFKAREVQYSSVLKFAPTGAFLYVSIALISFSSVSLALATGNSPLIETFEDGFVYFQIAFGAVILLYTFSNFMYQIEANQRVYEIFYKAKQFNFALAWFLGILIVGSLLILNSFVSYYQAFAGYFNSLGDLHYAQKDIYTSKQYYNLAIQYDRLNTRSYYSLGSLAEEENNPTAAFVFFDDANKKLPNPYAYAKVADYYVSKKKIFEAIFTLENGIKRCPESGELYNNLALLYNKVQAPDSALLYFDYGKNLSSSPKVFESNAFTIWTKYNVFQNLDSIYENQPIEYVGTASNELAFLNKIDKTADSPLNQKFLNDSILSTPNLCYLYNFALNKGALKQDTLINILENFEKVDDNAQFEYYLKFARANLNYRKGNILEATKLLKQVFNHESSTNPYYANLLALWHLEQNDHKSAAFYSDLAWQRGNQDALLNKAIAISEYEDKEKVIELWNDIKEKKTAGFNEIGSQMLKVLVKDSINIPELTSTNSNDLDRYKFLHYNKSLSNEIFDLIVSKIDNQDIMITALAEKLNYYVEKEDKNNSRKYYQELLKIENIVTKYTFKIVELAYLDFINKHDESFFNKVKSLKFNNIQKGFKDFYLASYYKSNKDSVNAFIHFDKALQSIPFHEPLYFNYITYCKSQNQIEKAYDIIIGGLGINERSIELHKLYILLCLEMQYFSYAEYGMQDLKNIVSDADYDAFKNIYETEKIKAEEAFQNFQ